MDRQPAVFTGDGARVTLRARPENPGQAAFVGGSIIIGAVLISVFGRKFINSKFTTTDFNIGEKPA